MYSIPYSGKFSLGSYFRDFADCIQSRENKNRNNLFKQKFILSNLIWIYRVFKRIHFILSILKYLKKEDPIPSKNSALEESLDSNIE